MFSHYIFLAFKLGIFRLLLFHFLNNALSSTTDVEDVGGILTVCKVNLGMVKRGRDPMVEAISIIELESYMVKVVALEMVKAI